MESLAQRISSRPGSAAEIPRFPGKAFLPSRMHSCLGLLCRGACAQNRKIWLLFTTLTPRLELGCPSLQLPLLHCIRAPVPSLPPEGPCTR